jgi:outer membrane protein assembly factor BamB
VGSCSGIYFALDRSTGKTRWTYDTRRDGDPAQFHGNPLITEDFVVTGSDGQGDGLVYALDRKTGELRWKTPVGGQDTDLLRSGGLAIGGTTHGGLVALDLASGKVAWRFTPANPLYRSSHSRSPALRGDRVFFASSDGKVYSLEAVSGKVVWERDLRCNIFTSLLLTDSGLYAGGSDRHLYRLDPVTGGITARIELEAEPYFQPVAAGRSILTLVGGKHLIALDPDLKGVLWKRTAPQEWTSSRPLVAGDAVLVGGPGELSAFRLSDGGPAWSLKVEGSPRGLSLAEPWLYLGTIRGMLSAYEIPGR